MYTNKINTSRYATPYIFCWHAYLFKEVYGDIELGKQGKYGYLFTRLCLEIPQ